MQAPSLTQPLVAARIREAAALLNSLSQSRAYLGAVAAVASVMAKALSSGHKILFFGNGGSAADAQHLAAELSGRFVRERPGLAGWALTTNCSVLTAIANDYSFEEVFARQVEGVGSPGDVAFGISTSGNSANVLRAIEVATRNKLVTVGLTGRTGGKLRRAVDFCICIPSDRTPSIQEAHAVTGHIICELVEEALFGTDLLRAA